MATKKKPKKKRLDFVINDASIEEAFTKLFIAKKRKPTWVEVGKEVGLDERTIRNHFKQINFDERMEEYKMGTSKVLAKTFIEATTGKDVAHKRLWFELVEGLGSKKELEHKFPDKQDITLNIS